MTRFYNAIVYNYTCRLQYTHNNQHVYIETFDNIVYIIFLHLYLGKAGWLTIMKYRIILQLKSQ